jgi:hypothetical protein
VGRKEQANDSPALKFELSPDFQVEGNVYRSLTTGVEDSTDYFEIAKINGRRWDGIETTLTMRVHDAGIGDEEHPAYYPYYYVINSVDDEGKVLEEEKFDDEEGFVIHFLDGAAVLTSAPDVRIPKTTVIDFRSTIPAPLVVPSQSELLKDDAAYAASNPFALAIW